MVDDLIRAMVDDLEARLTKEGLRARLEQLETELELAISTARAKAAAEPDDLGWLDFIRDLEDGRTRLRGALDQFEDSPLKRLQVIHHQTVTLLLGEDEANRLLIEGALEYADQADELAADLRAEVLDIINESPKLKLLFNALTAFENREREGQ